MKRIALFLFLSLAACKEGATNTSCSVAEDCDDADACTTDSCEGGLCQHAGVVSDECSPMCDVPANCDDGDACTTDECDDGVCANALIDGCGACEDETDCEDNDPCTFDGCDGDNLCGHDRVQTAACDACEDDGACTTDESCACADCFAEARCVAATDCTAIYAPDLTEFNEGDVFGIDLSELEGPGDDIMQAFASGSPEGVVDFAAIADHDDCFTAPGCAQLRLDFNTTPIEGMATSGTWEHHADGSGELYNVTFVEYTQGAGGAMQYVAGGKCWHLDHAHHEN